MPFLKWWVTVAFLWLVCLMSIPPPPFKRHPEIYPEMAVNILALVDQFNEEDYYEDCQKEVGTAVKTLIDSVYGSKIYAFSIDAECGEESISIGVWRKITVQFLFSPALDDGKEFVVFVENVSKI